MRSMLRPRLQPGLLRRGLCAASRPTTHFGYRTVDEADKERLGGNVFDSVASNYDVMNDLMSAGIHRAWKDSFVRMLGVSAQSSANLQMLDIAGGTGDIAFRIADELAAHPASSRSGEPDERARLVVSDINKQMLDEGQRRAEKLSPSRTAGWPKLEWVVADAMRLPFDDESFDVYTIAFGIRNVTRIDAALREAHRVLRPGGRFLCLEFSKVTNPLLRAAYEKYSFSVIPEIGRAVASDAASYQYLVESIQKFPDQEAFAAKIGDAGFAAVTHTNLTAGVVAVHSGVKLPA